MIEDIKSFQKDCNELWESIEKTILMKQICDVFMLVCSTWRYPFHNEKGLSSLVLYKVGQKIIQLRPAIQ